MTTLVVAAHPDDEVLGCGGTIARLAREGEDVHIAILGEGATSRADERGDADRAEVDRLRETAAAVGLHLGASSVRVESLPDNRFDTVPMLEIAKLVERIVEEVRPRVIFTQHGGDLNVDHQAVFRAVLTATRPVEGICVREIYGFEVGSSTEWAFQQFAPAFQPSVFVDVSETIEAKVEAMLMYDGEVRPFPHPRSPEALRAQARRWGAAAGVHAAEAFATVRVIR